MAMRLLPIAMTLASSLAVQSYANLILTNGKIWAGSSAQPQAEAGGVRGQPHRGESGPRRRSASGPGPKRR